MANTISFPTAVLPTDHNAANAFADDGNATDLFQGSYTDTGYSSFSGLSIPAGATINGIEVVGRGGANTSALEALVYNGTSWSSNKAANSIYGKGTSTIDPMWGANNDLWGLSWNATTAAGIQLKFDWSTLTSGRRLRFIYVKVRITYTEASGYGNAVNGVAPANIGKVDGVTTANIEKVIGV